MPVTLVSLPIITLQTKGRLQHDRGLGSG